MATKKTAKRKRSSSAAGEYVREEMHEAKKGEDAPETGDCNRPVAGRRAGEDVPPPKKVISAATRKKAESDYKAGSKKRATKKSAAKKSTAKKSAAKKKRTTKKATSKRR